MTKRLVFILSFLLALLVSVGAAFWVIVYQKQSPYPTELSGAFSLEISYADNLLTAQNGQLRGDLVKAGVEKTATPTTLVVKHTTPDGTVYSYPIHRAHTNVYKLENTELVYGVAEYNEDGSLKFTNNNSKLTAQTSGTTAVAVKVIIKDKDAANSATQRFLRALLDLPAPTDESAKNAPATFNANGMIFNVTNNLVKEVYQNNATVAMNAIAYNGSNYYGTIEGALAASTSGTVYVYPQTTVTLGTRSKTENNETITWGVIETVEENEGVPQNPYVIKNCTIASGVTLCLPWEDEKAMPSLTTIPTHESLVSASNNPVQNVDDTKLRTNHVTLHKGIKLINYGTLIVGSVIHSGNGGQPSGYSANQYAQITMKANSQIVNGTENGLTTASLHCYGYILEESNNNGSRVVMYGKTSYTAPFKVIENRGGTKFLGIKGKLESSRCAPFNRFYLPNMSSKLVVENNATINGFAALYANSQHNISLITLMGIPAKSLIQFTAATTSAEAKYTPSTKVLDLDIFGSCKLNPLALSLDTGILGTVSLSTSSVYFPLTWYFDISFSAPLSGGTATFTTVQDLKIMPGGKLTIGANVNATMSSVVVYDANFVDPAESTGAIASTLYESGKGPGVLTVNGSLTATNLAGVVQTKRTNAFISVTSGTTIASNELVSASGTGAQYSADNSTYTLTLSKRDNANESHQAKGSYYSAQQVGTTAYGWYKSPYTITLYNSTYTSTTPETIKKSTAGGYRPTARDSTRYYTFDNWYMDENYTQAVSTVYEDASFYAKWKLNVYNVEYDYGASQIENYNESKFVAGNAITQFSYTTSFNAALHKPTYEGYAFMGWRIGSVSGGSTTNLNDAVMNAATETATNDNDVQYTVKLYATWTKAKTYNLNLDYGEGANYEGVNLLPTTGTAFIGGELPSIDTNTPDYDYGTPKYFYGWAMTENPTVADKVETLTQEDIPADENAAITLYAIWVDKHKLTFNTTTNSGNVPAISIANIYLNGDQAYPLSLLKDTITQYDRTTTASKYFAGWTAGTNATISSDSVTATGNATITATWTDKYALTIVAQSGADKGTAININTTVYLLENQISDAFTEYDGKAKAQDTNTATNKYFVSWNNSITALSKDNFTDKKCEITASYSTKYSVKATSLSKATVAVDCTNHTTATLSKTNDAVWYKPNLELTLTVTYSGDKNFSFTVNNGSKDVLKNPENNSGTVKIESNLTVKASSECITADTLITLADGTQKRVDQLRGDELLLVWNLNTGKYDVAPIVFVDSENETEYEIIHLYFSDGSDVKVIYEHGFFDINLKKYVYIDAYNYAQFIGHEFVTQGDISSNTWKKATLIKVVIETERTTAYSPVTFEHLCYYTNGVLSMPGGISGLFNIFEVNTDTMSYNEEQMQKDIETYGLFSYDDFKDLIPEVAFDAFNGKWLKVAIGKGMLTWEDIEYLAARYVPLV